MQLYKRTYDDVDYLVDVDGKLVTDDTVYVEVGASGNPNACVLSLCSENQELSDIIKALGKTTAQFSSQELGTPDYTITIGDDFVDIVNEVATPAVTAFTRYFTGWIKYGGPDVTLVRTGYKTLPYQDGREGPSGEAEFFGAFDAQGNFYPIKCVNTENKWYGAYLTNPQGYGDAIDKPVAWGHVVASSAIVENQVIELEDISDPVWDWLAANGVNLSIWYQRP